MAPWYGPHYGVAAQGVLRGLGFLYILAFWSLASQIQALSGQGGLQPASALYEFYLQQVGPNAPWLYPGLGWVSQSPVWMFVLCGCGVLGGLGLLYGFLPWGSGFVAWICWVSVLQLCQPWLSTPGDLLMSEVGLYSLFLVPVFCMKYPKAHHMASRLVGIFLLNLLAVRVFFTSGMAKLSEEAGSWVDSTALYHYFETQPLPTAGAWFFHQLPGGLLTYLLWGWMFIELMLPWYVFLPRIFRNMFAVALVVHSVVLLMVGQHGVMPLLSFLLALSLVDDVSWRRLLPLSWGPSASTQMFRPGIGGVLCLLILVPCLLFHTVGGMKIRAPVPWKWVQEGLSRVYVGVTPPADPEVQQQRVEIALHGSMDGESWIEYPFWLKPTHPRSLAPVASLHVSRLDLAFESYSRSNLVEEENVPLWMMHLLQGLLKGDARMVSLFPENPFPDEPPTYLRLVLYNMNFADPVTRREKNVWWERTPIQVLGPIFSLHTMPKQES